MQAFLLVGAGGAIGAMGRYGVGLLVGRHWHGSFPLGTIVANVLGSLIMGILVGLLARYTPIWQGNARLFLAVGMLGGFTTFSSFSLDAMTLIERGHATMALGYIVLSVVTSILMLFVGLVITRGGL